MNTLIDLSYPLYNGMSNYPSDPEMRFETVKTIEKDFSKVTEISFGSHTATHVDVPSHIFEKGRALGDTNLSCFLGLAVKLSLINYMKYDLEKLKCDGIVLETGWGLHFWNSKIYFGNNRSSIPLSLIENFLKKSLKFFGCDLPCVDKIGTREKIIHRKFLSKDVVIYENLANLTKLPEGILFTFIGFPLNMQNIDGSPVRAMAVLKN